MKVCLLFTSGRIGGAERSLTRMVAASGTTPVSYLLGSFGAGGPWSDWARSLGLQVETFGNAEDEDGRISIGAAWRALRWTCRNRPDVIYVVGIRASLYIRLMRPLLGRAQVVHGIRSNYVPTSPWFKSLRRIELLLSPFTSMYIVNSRSGAETLHRWMGVPWCKLKVIPNGVDVQATRKRPNDPAPRPDIVITVANISPVKNHLGFIETIKLVLAERPDVRFRLVGRDDMHGAVQAAVREAGLMDRVEFLGHRNDVDALLQDARVFALPSLHEGMPTSVLEAMSHGLPVVAFAIDGLLEVVESGETGLLAPVGDHPALAQALLHYLQNDSDAERAGLAGRARIEQEFTLEATANAHARTFSQLVANRQRSRRQAD